MSTRVGKNPLLAPKTETALLSLARLSLGLQPGELQYLRDQPMEKFNIEKVVQTIPFESSRKWAGLVVKYKEGKNKKPFYRFFIKGAAEIVSKNCSYKRNSDDTLEEINEDNKKKLMMKSKILRPMLSEP